MKKLLGLLTAFVLVLAGCGSSTASADVTNEADDTLTIWGFYEGAPKVAMDYFEKETGTKVQYLTIGWDDYQTKLNTVLGTDDAPDVVMLERSFMGTYLPTDNILSLDDLFADDEQFQAYKENTALATEGPGIVNDEVKGIGWENTASAFFYRSDLAKQCLDINSVEEMEKATQKPEDYQKLQDQLKASSDPVCSNMSLFGYPDYQSGLLDAAGAYSLQDDGSYLITKQFGEALDQIKNVNAEGMVYSPDADKTQVVSGNADNKILGTVTPAWGMQAVLEYNQPGQWAVADTPIDYTSGGTYLAVTPQADTELVKQFFDMTFLNEDWLVDNMDEFGMVGNETVMNKYLENTEASNDYFGGQNTVQKFAEINDGITSYTPVSPYDAGISQATKEVLTGYAIDGSIKTIDDAKQQLKSKLEGLYPGLTVTIEE